jgi:hypothetical protein
MNQHDEPTPALNRRPILLLFLLLCVLFLISYTGRLGQLVGLRAEVAAKRAELADARDRQAALLDEQRYSQTEQFTDDVVRGQFGMSQPGDELIVPLDEAPVAQIAPAQGMEDAAPARAGPAPVWRQWWELFDQDG